MRSADISKMMPKIESNSVSNQRDLLIDFISRHPDLADSNILEFCDDGYSGTNFERPAVQQLLTKVRQGEINCIVVKDFSRFGRNYLELGDYLEQVFPFLGVRFISVNDGYDSAKDNGKRQALILG
jgi:DNA invertase Pin-like site-specific DNA recombinase